MIFFDCKVFNYFGELKRSVVRMQAIDACYTSRFLFDQIITEMDQTSSKNIHLQSAVL